MAKSIPQCLESAPAMPPELLKLVQEIGGGTVVGFPPSPNTGAKKGKRNDSAFRYACSLRARGVSWEEADVLIAQFAVNCIPTLAVSEAMNCLKSAWKYQSKYPLTDIGNTQRLLFLAEGNYRFCPDHNKWLVWTGTCWSPDNTGTIVELSKSIADLVKTEARNSDE